MGSNAQQFCLKWNNHQANMLAVFERLLGNKSLVDVTLGCEGRQMKAHKVVLSACSPFFEGLFTENPCKHPIVILKDIRYADLKALVEFMYKGEVNVVQEQLPTLLKTAEALKIKGLAEVTGESKDDSGGGSSNSQQQQARSAANATPRPESPNSGRRKRQRARRRSTDSAGAGDGLSDSEESVPKTSRTDLQDESSMDGASSHDDGSQASLQRASKKETAPVQTNVDSTSSPASASASAKNSRSAEQTTATNKSAANSNGQVPSSKDTGGGDFEPSRLLEASMTTDQGGDDSTDNLNNTTGPDNNSTNNELDIKPLITLDEGGATPTGAIVPASAAAAAALAGADALSSLFPQGASTAAALAGTSFQNSPPSHGTTTPTMPTSSGGTSGGPSAATAATAIFALAASHATAGILAAAGGASSDSNVSCGNSSSGGSNSNGSRTSSPAPGHPSRSLGGSATIGPQPPQQFPTTTVAATGTISSNVIPSLSLGTTAAIGGWSFGSYCAGGGTGYISPVATAAGGIGNVIGVAGSAVTNSIPGTIKGILEWRTSTPPAAASSSSAAAILPRIAASSPSIVKSVGKFSGQGIVGGAPPGHLRAHLRSPHNPDINSPSSTPSSNDLAVAVNANWIAGGVGVGRSIGAEYPTATGYGGAINLSTTGPLAAVNANSLVGRGAAASAILGTAVPTVKTAIAGVLVGEASCRGTNVTAIDYCSSIVPGAIGVVTGHQLKGHQQTHLRDRPYRCAECGYTTPHRNILYQHQSSEHPSGQVDQISQDQGAND